MVLRRWWVPGLAGALAVSLFAPTCLAGQLSNFRAQEQAVASQLAVAQGRYNAALASWNTAVANYLHAEEALRAGAAHLRAVISQEHRAEAALAAAQRAVAAAKVVVAQDQHKADQGLRVIDENGSVSFLSVLLGAHNFGDFLTRLSMLQKIWSMEMGFLGQARLAEAHLAVLERQQQADVNRIAALRRQAVAQVVALQAQDQRAAQARAAENVAVRDAQDAVAGLVSQRNGLLAKIRAILAALDSGNASWPQVLKLIDQLAGEYGISPALVEAVVLQESGGYAGAKSSAGAMGLMQLMPSTAAALGVSNAYDPVQNLKGGITYLLEMLQRFHGNVALALAAYNAGPGAVEKYGGVPPYQQTQRYVRNIMAMVAQGR